MDEQKIYLAFGLTILSAFVFLYGSDLLLSIQMGCVRGIWLPLLLVIFCPLVFCAQWGLFHLKKKEEERRNRPPSTAH